MRIYIVLMAAILLVGPARLQAQEVKQEVVSWQVQFLAAGADPVTGTPVQTATFNRADSLCGQPAVPVPSGTVVNPTEIRVADPADTTKDCILGPNASGALISVPLGNGYVVVVVARGATTVSARSAPSNPFDRALIMVPPNVPARIVVVRGGSK